MYEIDNIWLWYITILKYKIFYDIVSIRSIGGNMSNYKLDNKEVILYEGHGYYEEIKKDIQLVLTNKKIVIERMGRLFKKELKLVGIIPLEDIKIYKDKIQVKRQNDTVIIQTIDKNISILFDKYAEKTSSGIVNLTFKPDLYKSFNRGYTDYFLHSRKKCFNFWGTFSR